jgi:hypothetical protein
MAKRFTDTDLWDKEWFMALTCKHKCLVRFLFDKCDVAGVWSANWLLASSYIGEQVTEEDLQKIDGRVVKIGEGKYFIKDFIEFQYGTLSENCKPHQKVIGLLKKYNIEIDKIKGYQYPLQRVQEEEKDKEEEKGMEMEKEKDRQKKIESEKLLIPKMAAEFKRINPNYPENIEKDYPALLKISNFLAENGGIEKDVGEIFIELIIPYWRQICEHVANDNFFKNYSISQIEKHIQSIVLSIQNGTGNSTNGKGNKKLTSNDLEQAHSKYFG